jgi:hypothetical protein
MSKHESGKKIVAVVDDAAWHSFYILMENVSDQLTVWADEHNLPVGVMVGAAMGITSAVAHFANLCHCDTCMEVPIAFSDEVVSRIEHAHIQMAKAVH